MHTLVDDHFLGIAEAFAVRANGSELELGVEILTANDRWCGSDARSGGGGLDKLAAFQSGTGFLVLRANCKLIHDTPNTKYDSLFVVVPAYSRFSAIQALQDGCAVGKL